MPLTALQASAYLHHLHLHSPDPERLAAFYTRALEMTAERTGDSWQLDGPSRRLLISEGPAKHLAHAAFAVRDAEGLAGLRAHAQGNDLAPRDIASSLLADAFGVTDPDGNVVVFGLATEAPNAADRRLRAPLQHLTLATRDVQAIEAFYAGKLGFGVSDRVVREDGKVMTCFMRGNHEHHNLACFYQDRQGIDHHSYEAGEWDTLRDWCDNLATQGIQLMWGPGRHGPGNNLFIFIEDVDGNWIEISAELEVIHDRPVKHWPHAPRTLNQWGNAIMRA
ncbi:catechol 2,3-dioxygenase [Bradyrhizobium sp. USDA 4463]